VRQGLEQKGFQPSEKVFEAQMPLGPYQGLYYAGELRAVDEKTRRVSPKDS
jgi:hypothetical protein